MQQYGGASPAHLLEERRMIYHNTKDYTKYSDPREHYRRLHAPAYQLLASTPPPLWEDELHSRDMRVAVALVREGKFKGQYSGGVGDRFTGLVTVFALSLLNDVPFFIDFPHLSKVLSRGSGNINWDINIREYIEHKGYRNIRTSYNFWRHWYYEQEDKKNILNAKLKPRTKRTINGGQHPKKKGNANQFSFDYFKKPAPRPLPQDVVNSPSALTKSFFKPPSKNFSPQVATSQFKPRSFVVPRKAPIRPRPNASPQAQLTAVPKSVDNKIRRRASVIPKKSKMVEINSSKYTAKTQYQLEYLLETRNITVVRNSRGHIMDLFKEGKYPKRLKYWGLTRDNMYGCLFDYLFSPGSNLQRDFKAEVEKLTDPDTLKILVQIRVGDDQIGKGVSNLSTKARNLATAFFACASLIEEAVSFSKVFPANSTGTASDSNIKIKQPVMQYSNAVWYLMTDSKSIKKFARDKYGDKVIMHDSKIINMLKNTEGYDLQSFSDVIGEQWCGSLCDYFVTSSNSGLGLQAAFRSKQVDGKGFPIDTNIVTAPDVHVVPDRAAYLEDKKIQRTIVKRIGGKNGRNVTVDIRRVIASEMCKAEDVATFGARYSAI